jgi:rfaE bifunctional protein kinase chain/domain
MQEPTTLFNPSSLRRLLGRIGRQRIVVVGDLYLDHYIFGTPSRISREAPVMVLDERRREDRLGGGAAPALALATLGCEVAVIGVVGDDEEGRLVIRLLEEAGIDAGFVTADPTRPTTTKLRVVAEGFLLFPQQLVRVDRQERALISASVEQALVRALQASEGQAILVSDYRSGVTTDSLIETIRQVSQSGGQLTAVDSQGALERYHRFSVVKCNQAEAEAVLGGPLGDLATRERQLTALQQRLQAGCLVVTRGGQGASVVSDEGYQEIPAANQSEVYDVTGAGDTVIAVTTAALLAGASGLEAAALAQVAAGVVVRKWGNAQASRAELEEALALTPLPPLPLGGRGGEDNEDAGSGPAPLSHTLNSQRGREEEETPGSVPLSRARERG